MRIAMLFKDFPRKLKGKRTSVKWQVISLQSLSSNPDKKEQILEMGASKVINSTSPEELAEVSGKLNLILNTTNVALDWNSYLMVLAPQGKFHNVGAVLEPMAIPAFTLIMGEKSVGGSP